MSLLLLFSGGGAVTALAGTGFVETVGLVPVATGGTAGSVTALAETGFVETVGLVPVATGTTVPSWGTSWGSSWGTSWGTAETAVLAQPGAVEVTGLVPIVSVGGAVEVLARSGAVEVAGAVPYASGIAGAQAATGTIVLRGSVPIASGSGGVAPPDDTSGLLYDVNDGAFVYDANDGIYLSDGILVIVPPPIPGDIDATGGPIGGPIGDRVVLVDTPESEDEEDAEPAWRAIADHPIMGHRIGSGSQQVQPFVFRLANRDFTSRHDDLELASGYWDGRVIDPGSIALTLPLVPVGENAIQTRFGQIVIDNSDAAYDTVLDYQQIVSQPIRVRIGTIKGYLGNFETVCVARITAVGTSQTELLLDIRDPASYAQNLYPTSVYAGTGGANGSSDLTDAVKPIVLGRVWNVTPTLIDAVNLIYQAHDGPMAAVTGVFDGGVALSFAADYTTYSALVAASTGPGQYATCLAEGMVKVDSSPVFAITAHIDGQSAAGTTVRSIAGWLAKKLELELGLDVDLASFDALPAVTAGWVWTEPFTMAEALSRFVGDAGWYWGADVDGTVRTYRLLDPDEADVARVYDVSDIVDLVREPMPEGFGGVHHRRIVQYLHNWTVQNSTQLAATAVSYGYRQREWKNGTIERVTGARNAIDPPVLQTSIVEKVDALLLADHLLNLHGVPRRMFTLSTRIFWELPILGSTVMVRHPRFGLIGGGYFRVIDIDLRLRDGGAVLLLWG